MKQGDRLKIEIPKPKLNEKLNEVASIRIVLKPGSIIELEDRELIFVRNSPINNNWSIVRAPDGNEYEVCKDFLKRIE